MAKVKQGIKRLTNQAMSKPRCDVLEDADAFELPSLKVEDKGKMVASGVLDKMSQEAGGTSERSQMMLVQMVNKAIWLVRKSWPEYKQLEELINRGIIDEQGLQMAHSTTGMTDLQCEQMLKRTIVNEKTWEAVAKVLGRKACSKVLSVQGNEVKPQEGCNNGQNRDKENGFSMKMAEDETRVQGNEVNPQEFLTSTSTGTRRRVSA